MKGHLLKGCLVCAGVLLLLITLLQTEKDTRSANSRNIAVIAHRGVSFDAPENTLSSFRHAIDLGVDYIELDVHLTKDGIPVVLHDQVLSRTTEIPYPKVVSDLKLSQVETIDVGLWFHEDFKGEKIPTLDEVLELPLIRTGLMIEVKEGSASEEELAHAVTGALKGYVGINRKNFIYVGSVSPKILEHVKKNMPNLPTIAIVHDPEIIDQHLKNSPDIFAIHHSIATPTILEKFKEHGKKVWVWTVDDLDALPDLIQSGIDGIITNRPKIFQEALLN